MMVPPRLIDVLRCVLFTELFCCSILCVATCPRDSKAPMPKNPPTLAEDGLLSGGFGDGDEVIVEVGGVNVVEVEAEEGTEAAIFDNGAEEGLCTIFTDLSYAAVSLS